MKNRTLSAIGRRAWCLVERCLYPLSRRAAGLPQTAQADITLLAKLYCRPPGVVLVAYLDANRRIIATENRRHCLDTGCVLRRAVSLQARGVIVTRYTETWGAVVTDDDNAFAQQLGSVLDSYRIALIDVLVVGLIETVSLSECDPNGAARPTIPLSTVTAANEPSYIGQTYKV